MNKYFTPIAHYIKRTACGYFSRFLVLCGIFLLFRFIEIAYNCWLHGLFHGWFGVLFTGAAKDICFLLTIGGWGYLFYLSMCLIGNQFANIIFTIISVVLCSIHLALLQYFLTTLTPLGADLWTYSLQDLRQTYGAAGIKLSALSVLLILSILSAWAIIKLPRTIKPGPGVSLGAIILFIACQWVNMASIAETVHTNSSEFGNSLSINKSYFFYSQTSNYFFPKPADIDIYADNYIGDYNGRATAEGITNFKFTDETNYPFLHTDETPDALSAFIRKTNQKPNIIIVLVEGLGRAFSNEGAYLGSFTPFLDSLSAHSLYWENFLSSGGRTFAALPSLLASLPFAQNGFADLASQMPEHLSLISMLKHNGYHTSFYYGGNANFDNMALFLQKNAIDNIYDMLSFPPGYNRLPTNGQGFSWGYGDKELFRYFFSTLEPSATPSCTILLTLATHNPFLVNDEVAYLARFERHLIMLNFDETRKTIARNYKMQFASILYADDALKQFFQIYSQQPDFNNTIFLITGDHRMPEIPMIDKLDRYHVPLVIFSPLLTRSMKFSSISTHFDITPSLLQMLKNQYDIEVPSLADWMGSGIDTTHEFINKHAFPLMQTKNNLVDFIQGQYMINETGLYQINRKMQVTLMDNKGKFSQLQVAFDDFKQKNSRLTGGARLIPDSIYQRYYP